MADDNILHNRQDSPIATQQNPDAADGFLALSLSLSSHHPELYMPLPPVVQVDVPATRQSRRRLMKSETIEPPYPWATDRRATVHTLAHLLSNGISVISGSVQCKKCEHQYEMEVGLESAYDLIRRFVVQNKDDMYHRAAACWQSPRLPKCRHCDQENCTRPLISGKKRSINWLFLFLAQLLGCCTLDQLKYFCKHTKNHRTGAKNRVLFLAYLGICRQLEPDGPFDI